MANGIYKEGEVINIGYYGGFRHQELIKTQAEVISVSDNVPSWIDIKVRLSHGGYKTMFGYASQLKELEKNYNK